MRWLLIIIILIVWSSCSNQKAIEKKLPTQLDSLLNFDTIVSIYTYSPLPPQITHDEIEDGPEAKADAPSALYIDSINKWTNSIIILDSIKKIFPQFIVVKDGAFETSNCDCYKELFIVTKKQKHILSFLTHTGEGTIRFDEERIVYKTNLDKLYAICDLLDRKIIRKEIPMKDSINYNLKDIYNRNYYYKGQEGMVVYLLK
jgi:hypothetical protein